MQPGDSKEMKILVIPTYKPREKKTGKIVKELTETVLTSWNCEESIVNLVFDTTASNTGHISAACATLQQYLDRALLWSGCRHHIGEVIVSHVFKDFKIEASSWPETMLFVRFRKQWEALSTASPNSFHTLLLSEVNNVDELVKVWLEEVRLKATSQLSLKRDDYKEFVELCLLFLAGVKENPKQLRRPGAVHKAQWLAKNIYLIKLTLLEDEISKLPMGSVTIYSIR